MNTVKNNEKVTEICNAYSAFLDFKGMVANYIRNYNVSLEFALFGYWICKMDKIHQTLFMMYILEYWNAYAMDIINGTYKYINLTDMVRVSYLEHMAR